MYDEGSVPRFTWISFIFEYLESDDDHTAPNSTHKPLGGELEYHLQYEISL